MSYQTLNFEEKDAVAIITFNRPQSLNALSKALLDEFVQALDLIATSPAVRVLILTGAGPKAFIAGADIREIAKCDAIGGKGFARHGQSVMAQLEALPVPVIAAVNGYALGGGLEVALACDFIYASQSAMFGLPEINLGIIPGFGGTQRLTRLVGKQRAKEMIFTGRHLSAQEALDFGLVNKICAPEELMEAVYQTAQEIAAKGAVALMGAKQAIDQGADLDLANACNLEANAFALCLASEDAGEGTNAFLEKRKPEFKAHRP
jgi:enoyl-CoA hydratase